MVIDGPYVFNLSWPFCQNECFNCIVIHMPHLFDLWGESCEKRLYFDSSFIYCIPYLYTDNFSRYLTVGHLSYSYSICLIPELTDYRMHQVNVFIDWFIDWRSSYRVRQIVFTCLLDRKTMRDTPYVKFSKGVKLKNLQMSSFGTLYLNLFSLWYRVSHIVYQYCMLYWLKVELSCA